MDNFDEYPIHLIPRLLLSSCVTPRAQGPVEVTVPADATVGAVLLAIKRALLSAAAPAAASASSSPSVPAAGASAVPASPPPTPQDNDPAAPATPHEEARSPVRVPRSRACLPSRILSFEKRSIKRQHSCQFPQIALQPT